MLLTFLSPVSPVYMDWSSHYPAFVKPAHDGAQGDQRRQINDSRAAACLTKGVEVADIGCGFGGLLVALAPLMPDALLLGEPFSALRCSLH